jgi:hypothetical protein
MGIFYRRQRPVKGGREALPSCVLADIKRHVEADAMKYGVSKSFVISVILAKAYKVREQEPLEEKDGPKAPIVPIPVKARPAALRTSTTRH